MKKLPLEAITLLDIDGDSVTIKLAHSFHDKVYIEVIQDGDLAAALLNIEQVIALRNWLGRAKDEIEKRQFQRDYEKGKG